jgi:hypothetical protein
VASTAIKDQKNCGSGFSRDQEGAVQALSWFQGFEYLATNNP